MKASLLRAARSTIATSCACCSGVLSSKSNLVNAARNSADESSKYGVPGPTFGRVAQAAPAGIRDSRPFSLNPTQPRDVLSGL